MNSFNWNDSTVLVTGGTGSFGKKFVELLIKDKKPKKLIVFSRDELKQSEMKQEFNDNSGVQLRYFIGDIRDKDRVSRAFNGVDIVVHAAALKHVPVCEYNPFEAVKTNIIGAQNIIDAAIDNNVKRVVALSTDKAVNPINLYGATKLVSDKLFIHGNAYVGDRDTRFSCVRYGNVVGSRGSVVPLFLKQRKNGKITITDLNMTRFWITLEQGIQLVMKAIETMEGGEIYVPKIPSMSLKNIVEALAPNSDYEIIGIRPGEKLHEVLLSSDEVPFTREYKDMYIIRPNLSSGNVDINQYLNLTDGKKVHDDFYYASNNNDTWLSEKELLSMIEEFA